MRSSLRGRLVVFYTAMLALVVVAFGALACYLTWRSRLDEIDVLLHERAQVLADALRPAPGGTFDLVLPPPAESSRGTPEHVVLAPDGEIIDRSDPDLDIPPLAPPGVRTRDGLRELAIQAASGSTVITARSLDVTYEEIVSLAAAIGALGAAALVLTFAGGWWLVGRALAPIDRISRTARTMVEGNFNARIPEDRVETELGQLVRALNDAFDRLHGSLERQRRFTADASHELRTPLATISTELQWARARERQPAEYRRSLEVSARAAARMQAVVERLLALARAEAGADTDRAVEVRLDELVRSVAADLEPLARARRVSLHVDAEAAAVTGDPDRLRDAVTNVVANAIQYNVDGGDVRIAVRMSEGAPEVMVNDTGIGIAPGDLACVFDPFFRADAARHREAAGAGLGLAVTRAILRRHGGDATCQSEPGSGTSVVLRFPATQRASSSESIRGSERHSPPDTRGQAFTVTTP